MASVDSFFMRSSFSRSFFTQYIEATIPDKITPVTTASIFLIPFFATFDSSDDDFLRKNIMSGLVDWMNSCIVISGNILNSFLSYTPYTARLLLPYLDRLRDECEFWYLNHDNIVFYSCTYLIESEIFRKYYRTRKCSIKTLFHKKALRLEVYGSLLSVS